MDAGASFSTSASLLLSRASISTGHRRYCWSRIPILPHRTCNYLELLRVAPSTPCCRVSISVKASRTEIRESYPEEFHDSKEISILSLLPLSGRYRPKMRTLFPFFTDYGMTRYRAMVEVEWLIKLLEIPEIAEIYVLSEDARSFLKTIVDSFSIKDALEVKKFEKAEHKINAIEIFLKQQCASCPEVTKVLELFNFGCTYQDIKNLAYAISLKEALYFVILPLMADLEKAISNLAKENSQIPILSSTRRQPASPTTLEMKISNFAVRLCNKRKMLSGLCIFPKFTGVENCNAHKVAYPNVNWPSIAEEFVTSFGLEFNAYVTQNESHDYIARLLLALVEFNNILLDFDNDIWSFISLGFIKQTSKPIEVGSSTMPHKINPIDFENSEGNLGMTNDLLIKLAMKLPISRKERDLTDSTLLRSVGCTLGHCLLAYSSALQGIQKLQVNQSCLSEGMEHA